MSRYPYSEKNISNGTVSLISYNNDQIQSNQVVDKIMPSDIIQSILADNSLDE